MPQRGCTARKRAFSGIPGREARHATSQFLSHLSLFWEEAGGLRLLGFTSHRSREERATSRQPANRRFRPLADIRLVRSSPLKRYFDLLSDLTGISHEVVRETLSPLREPGVGGVHGDTFVQAACVVHTTPEKHRSIWNVCSGWLTPREFIGRGAAPPMTRPGWRVTVGQREPANGEPDQ